MKRGTAHADLRSEVVDAQRPSRVCHFFGGPNRPGRSAACTNREWARRKEATPAQIALAWLLAQKPWIVPIPGTTNPRHLDENLGAIAVKFTPEELRELNAAASRIVVQGARFPQPSLELTRREAPLRDK